MRWLSIALALASIGSLPGNDQPARNSTLPDAPLTWTGRLSSSSLQIRVQSPTTAPSFDVRVMVDYRYNGLYEGACATPNVDNCALAKMPRFITEPRRITRDSLGGPYGFLGRDPSAAAYKSATSPSRADLSDPEVRMRLDFAAMDISEDEVKITSTKVVRPATGPLSGGAVVSIRYEEHQSGYIDFTVPRETPLGSYFLGLDYAWAGSSSEVFPPRPEAAIEWPGWWQNGELPQVEVGTLESQLAAGNFPLERIGLNGPGPLDRQDKEFITPRGPVKATTLRARGFLGSWCLESGFPCETKKTQRHKPEATGQAHAIRRLSKSRLGILPMSIIANGVDWEVAPGDGSWRGDIVVDGRGPVTSVLEAKVWVGPSTTAKVQEQLNDYVRNAYSQGMEWFLNDELTKDGWFIWWWQNTPTVFNLGGGKRWFAWAGPPGHIYVASGDKGEESGREATAKEPRKVTALKTPLSQIPLLPSRAPTPVPAIV